MLRQITSVGVALLVALAVAGFAFSTQNRAQDQKKDVRMSKGNMPGGVTLFDSEKTLPVAEGRELATFGGG